MPTAPNRLGRLWQREELVLAVLSVVTGLAAGLGAVAFRHAISGVQFLVFGSGTPRLASYVAALPWWQVLLAPALGGLVVGLIARYLTPGGRFHVVSDVIEASTLHGGRMRLRDGCMAAIGAHQVRRAVLEAAATRPFLGICMGLQVLMDFSEENRGTALLGLYAGRVCRFPGDMGGAAGLPLKIPHMGWNRVGPTREHPLWNGIEPGTRFYFVHSYYVDPADSTLPAARTEYGIPFSSALARDNVFAVQFHPEKSADAGLRLLENFVNWRPSSVVR